MATILVALAGLFVAGSVVWQEVGGMGGGSGYGPAKDREVSGWVELSSNGNRLGPENAGVTVVVFGDYECPYCKRAERVLRGLRDSFPQDLAVVFRHYPLSIHPNAPFLARMAECGAQQGGFEEIHELLMDERGEGGLDPTKIAVDAHLPSVERFVQCAQGTAELPQIIADGAAADDLDIQSVPKIIIEGMMLGRAPDSAGLTELVHQYLAETRNPSG